MSTALIYSDYPDVPGNMRAALARKRRGSSDLAREFGRSQAYWSRKINGREPWKMSDIECIAMMAEVHPSELFGGQAPQGWTPPECAARDSNPEPADYVPIRHLHAVA